MTTLHKMYYCLTGDTRISKMLLVSEDQSSKLMCQALQYPEKDVTLTSLNENFKGIFIYIIYF